MARRKQISKKKKRVGQRRSYLVARGNKFLAGGISTSHGPLVVGGYRKGRFKLKASAGAEGVKASASFRIAPRTEVSIEHNLISKSTQMLLKRKRKRIRL